MTKAQAVTILSAHSVEWKIEKGILWALECWTERESDGSVSGHDLWIVVDLETSGWMDAFLGY